jgi:hypothetical protein
VPTLKYTNGLRRGAGEMVPLMRKWNFGYLPHPHLTFARFGNQDELL